jgi:hypothetical protein
MQGAGLDDVIGTVAEQGDDLVVLVRHCHQRCGGGGVELGPPCRVELGPPCR